MNLRLSSPLALLAFTLPAAFMSACGGGNGNPNGNTCTGVTPGDLVISEIMANPAGDDTGNEWFEVYNASSSNLDVGGLVLSSAKSDGTGEKVHTVQAGTQIASGQYFVFGDVLQKFAPSFVNYGYGGDLGSLTNTGGQLALKCNGTVIDKVVYGDMSKTDGVAWGLDGSMAPDPTTNDDFSKNWCPATQQYQTGSYGSPGKPNQPCAGTGPQTMCDDNGTMRMVNAPGGGDLVVSEIMANPCAPMKTDAGSSTCSVSDADGEWFEVYANANVDLNGLSVGTALDSPSMTINDPSCLPIKQGSYIVFAHSKDMTVNGGIPKVDQTFSFTLANGGSSIVLSDGSNLVDQVTYGQSNVTSGTAFSLDPRRLDAKANDDLTNWCAATTQYGAGDLGTPGAANPQCNLPVPPGMCDDNGTIRAVVSPAMGDIHINEYMADPSAVSDTVGEWFELRVDKDVDLNGLQFGTTVGTTDYTIDLSACQHVTAGSFVLFARNGDMTMNGGLPKVDYVYGSAISLLNSSGGLFVADPKGNVLDQVTYTSKATTGASTQLDPTKAGTYCTTPAGNTYGAGDLGTPGAANVACP